MDSTVLAVARRRGRGGCGRAVRPVADRAGAAAGSRRPRARADAGRGGRRDADAPRGRGAARALRRHRPAARTRLAERRRRCGRRRDRRESPSAGTGRWCSGCRSSRSYVALARDRLAHPPAADVPDPPGRIGARWRWCWSAGLVTGTGRAWYARSSAGWWRAVFFFVLWFWIYPRGLGFGDVRLAGRRSASRSAGWAGGTLRGRPVRRLPPRRGDRRRCSPLLHDRGPEGLPVRPVHAARRVDRPALGRRRSGRSLVSALTGPGRAALHGRLTRMLRWLTAGESHGPALVAILEGLPAHVAITTDDVSAALARRRLGKGRGARMTFEQDRVTILGGVRHGETIGGPVAIEIANTEWPKWEQVMSADPVDAVGAGRPRPQRAADPAPARARRPGRACRSTASTRRARCSSAPRPARPRPGSRWGAWRARSSSRPPVPGSCPTSSSWAACAPRPASFPGPTTSPASTPTRCAASTPSASAAMVGRDRPGPPGRRHARRRRRGRRARPAARPRLPRALGPPARLAAGRRADGDPGDQGRRGRRRLRARRDPRQPGPRRDRADRRRRSGVPAAARAAPRAGCRPARCCGCGPR